MFNNQSRHGAAPYLIALAVIWAGPLVSVLTLVAATDSDHDTLLFWSWVGTFLGAPLALLVTAVVIPVIALSLTAASAVQRRSQQGPPVGPSFGHPSDAAPTAPWPTAPASYGPPPLTHR